MNKCLLTAVLLSITLSGCAAVDGYYEKRGEVAAKKRERQKIVSSIVEDVPVCDGEAQCTAMWEAAQLWVAKNAGYKIQILSNVLIETYSSTDMSLAARITKEPVSSGKYKIVALVRCSNPFGCITKPDLAVADFNQRITAAGR